MTREEKINWIRNASNDELLDEYLNTRRLCEQTFEGEYFENANLLRTEIVLRMSKEKAIREPHTSD